MEKANDITYQEFKESAEFKRIHTRLQELYTEVDILWQELETLYPPKQGFMWGLNKQNLPYLLRIAQEEKTNE